MYIRHRKTGQVWEVAKDTLVSQKVYEIVNPLEIEAKEAEIVVKPEPKPKTKIKTTKKKGGKKNAKSSK